MNCLVAGLNTAVLAGGVVATVAVQPSPQTSAGNSSIHITNAFAAEADGTVSPAASSAAVITLTGIQCAPSILVTPAVAVCTVSLATAAGSGGATFGLFSSNPNLTMPASVTVAADARRATFSISASAVSAGGSATVTAKLGTLALSTNLMLAAKGTAISIVDVTNAADYLPGPLAPGEMISIFGTGVGPAAGVSMQVQSGEVTTALAGTRVFFNGTPAPLLYVRSNQVNAVVPYGLWNASAAQMLIEYQGVLSEPLTLPVALTNPAIFTADSSGEGQGAIFNEDGSHNSAANPAKRDSIVMLYATGAGPMIPTPPDGTITGTDSPAKPLAPVTVWIGGMQAELTGVRAAAAMVAGLLQVNARVPKGIAPGPAVPVVLAIGGAQNPSRVTIAVQ